MNEIDYQLNYDKLGNKRKYRLSGKKRTKIIDNNTWQENTLNNQWIYKDYKSYYIVISMYKQANYRVSCSGYTLKKEYKSLDQAKMASFKFCNKLYR